MAYTSPLLAALPGVRHAFLNAAESAAFDRSLLVDIKQVHGAEIFAFDCQSTVRPQVDGVFTANKGQHLGIYTADCLPLLIASRDGNYISSVHAGWKGAAQGIVQRAVTYFTSACVASDDILVAIGPHIRTCCYEVSDGFERLLLDTPAGEVVRQSRDSLFFTRPQHPTARSAVAREEKSLWFDLSAFCLIQLLKAGIPRDNIDILPFCTYCTPDDALGSYRRRTHFPAEKTQQISWIIKAV